MPSTLGSESSVVYAAAVWWFAFAAVSFYWAGGGTVGLTTLGEEINSLAAEGGLWFMALVALTGVLKLVPALLVLSLIRPWGDWFPRKISLVVICTMGVLSFLYGGAGMALKLLVLIGVISPNGIDSAGFWGHLLIWDPVWMIGGILLCLAAWNYRTYW